MEIENNSIEKSLNIDIDDDDDNIEKNKETVSILLNTIFNILLTILIFILFMYLISCIYNYNFFPFNIEKPQNYIYHIAQFVGLSSIAMKNILILRILSITSSVFYILWSVMFFDNISIDFFVYTAIYITINLKQIMKLLYEKRIIYFDQYREQIYINIFEGILNRSEFQKLIKISFIRELPKDSYYCRTNDKCTSLSILIKGELKKFKNKDNSSSRILENEFIDSSEFLLNRSQNKNKRGKRFNSNLVAVEKCLYLTWPREILLDILKKNPLLENKLQGVLGIDVSDKLFNDN
jgi:hypothetical protein